MRAASARAALDDAVVAIAYVREPAELGDARLRPRGQHVRAVRREHRRRRRRPRQQTRSGGTRVTRGGRRRDRAGLCRGGGRGRNRRALLWLGVRLALARAQTRTSDHNAEARVDALHRALHQLRLARELAHYPTQVHLRK